MSEEVKLDLDLKLQKRLKQEKLNCSQCFCISRQLGTESTKRLDLFLDIDFTD